MEPVLNTDVVIIGGGAAGLYAASQLLKAGKKVVIVEGRNRLGGRIHTLEYQFTQPVDAGAEFMHGEPPITKQLLKLANTNTLKKKGKIYQCKNGELKEVEDFIEGRKQVLKALNNLYSDETLTEFLEHALVSEENAAIRRSLLREVQGFDAADPDRISAISVREEMKSGMMDTAYHIEDGYMHLVNLLHQQCLARGCKIYLSSPAKSISWQANTVKVRCGEQRYVEAKQAIITVPIGVLTALASTKSYFDITPPLPHKTQAAKQIGYGTVVKVILEFKNKFWHDDAFKTWAKQVPDLDFLIGEGEFPIWWTQPGGAPILTGWLGGPNASGMAQETDAIILQKAMEALAIDFCIDRQLIDGLLRSYKIANWGNDAFAMGAYSYETPETKAARKILLEPEQNTLYFCGEALDESGYVGTVEAALSSAEQCVKKMLGEK